MDKSSIIFNNKLPKKVVKKGISSQKKFIKKFGDDREKTYHLKIEENEHIGDILGVKNLTIDYNANEKTDIDYQNAIIIGNIRMGFGHYRISMAMASAAKAMGYTPYWMDLNSYKETTCGKVINYQNKLYSMGSRLSAKSKLFNKYYWEPLNYEGFKQLSYNSGDQKNAELMTTVYKEIPKDIPYIATHVWPAQAAIHSGMTNVVNAIPDNWPMALHLAEGSIHTVQTYSSYLGYRTLYNMSEKVLLPMGEDDIKYTGHYIDHELVVNIEEDCKRRIDKINNGRPLAVLLTIGGAGAQQEIFMEIIKFLSEYIKEKKVTLYVNVGDYHKVWDAMSKKMPILKEATTHFDSWSETREFAAKALEEDVYGIHAFCHSDIFEAVYATNLLMRSCDLLVTKPSELAFYPVPKLFIQRVGGHERWGAIHAAEIGDGTIECDSVDNAINMLKLLMNDKSLLEVMNTNIIANKSMGIYNGAYEVVKLATKSM